MKSLLACIVFCFCLSSYAQNIPTNTKETDTTEITHLSEVVVIGRHKLNNYKQEKALSSIDDYLEKSSKVSMIKRGNYAWEPTINNMASERISVTIDGMQIFGACTDKMDPVTSYVDVSNLEKVTISSGQQGSQQSNSIGGNINMQLPTPKYYNTGLKSSIDLGYETNGNYKSSGLDLEYSGNKLFLAFDGIYRDSDNYKAGNDQEINYSQFNKYNLSFLAGYKFSEKHSLEGQLIYDRATDVGYPALPMDVSLAEATIASITHKYQSDTTLIRKWESKLYLNTITHIMDDSQRPDVPIRMDMPGWSDTYGGFSKAEFTLGAHQFQASLNAHYNKSLAEMTMYPNDPNQNAMFMFTWPDVRTLYSGIFLKDSWRFKKQQRLEFGVRIGYHNNKIGNTTGLESLQIFYPNMNDSKSRLLKSFSINYVLKHKALTHNFGIGYGERAPSVSEGYGFFLFNSFDNYDYIGNPYLNNEKSFEASWTSGFSKGNLDVALDVSFFHIKDYIIGEIDPTLSAMTIGASGVRRYTALSHANMFNTALEATYKFSKTFSANAALGYNYGEGSGNKKLPLIAPLSYSAQLSYNTSKFSAALQLNAHGKQHEYSKAFGEDQTPDYAVLNLNLGNYMTVKANRLVLKYGVENIFDTLYSTYADWNNVPRPGRNFYANVSYIMF